MILRNENDDFGVFFFTLRQITASIITSATEDRGLNGSLLRFN